MVGEEKACNCLYHDKGYIVRQIWNYDVPPIVYPKLLNTLTIFRVAINRTEMSTSNLESLTTLSFVTSTGKLTFHASLFEQI